MIGGKRNNVDLRYVVITVWSSLFMYPTNSVAQLVYYSASVL